MSARLLLPDGARACYVLAHGAGAGMDHPFMRAACDRARARSASPRCATSSRTWSSGTRRTDAPPLCHATVRAAVAEGSRSRPALPLFAGGRSFGGRMSSQAQAHGRSPGVRGARVSRLPAASGRYALGRARRAPGTGAHPDAVRAGHARCARRAHAS